MNKPPIDFHRYQKEFSESRLWTKLQKVARKAGVKVVYAVLLGFYVLADKNVPYQDKAKIVGALGYFILPLDMLPDTLPVVGYTDDMTALFWALKSVWINITPETHARAKAKLEEWFDEVNEEDLHLFS